MGNNLTVPPHIMSKLGNDKLADNVFADERGWCLTHLNGTVEVLHCIKGLVESPANPVNIGQVANMASKEYAIGDNLDFKVTWTEPVAIDVAGGVPSMAFNIGGTTKQALLIGGTKPSATRSTFRFVADEVGAVDTVVTTLALNSGTILAVDDGTPAVLTFPADYVQPVDVTVA